MFLKDMKFYLVFDLFNKKQQIVVTSRACVHTRANALS